MGGLVDAARSLLLRAAGPKAQLPQVSTASGVLYSPEGRAQKTNVNVWRAWGRWSPWIRTAINIRKDQIASADFEIGPLDPERKYSKRLARDIQTIFNRPNPRDRSFRAFIEPIIDDLLTLDAGVSEAVTSMSGDLQEIWPVDAAFVRVARNWSGDRREPRYFWYPDGQLRGSWLNSEMSYMMLNATTYSPLGIPPPEVLKVTIDTLLSGIDYNRRQITGAAPDGLLHLGEGVPPEKVEAFRSEWLAFQQQGGAMTIIGGGKNPSYQAFRSSNRDMQFTEFIRFLVTECANVYGLSLQDFQQLFDINRSEGENQTEWSEDRGLRPLADKVQDEMTQQYVHHASFGGPDNNLAFRFTRLKIKESYQKAQINKIGLAGVPWNTINQALIDEGREPVGDINDPNNAFNQRLANTPLGMVRLTENPADIPTPAELLLQQKASKTPASTNGKSPSTAPAPVAQGQTKEN